MRDGIVENISAQTVQRILYTRRLKPWRVHHWLSAKVVRDEAFRVTVETTLDLYTRQLGAHPRVLSVDEKTSLQPRTRTAPTKCSRRMRRRKRQDEFLERLEKIDAQTSVSVGARLATRLASSPSSAQGIPSAMTVPFPMPSFVPIARGPTPAHFSICEGSALLSPAGMLFRLLCLVAFAIATVVGASPTSSRVLARRAELRAEPRAELRAVTMRAVFAIKAVREARGWSDTSGHRVASSDAVEATVEDDDTHHIARIEVDNHAFMRDRFPRLIARAFRGELQSAASRVAIGEHRPRGPPV